MDGTYSGVGGTFQKNSYLRETKSFRQTSRTEQEKTMADNEGGASGLGWFLAGLGIGTLIGVLYAPKAGKETREDIMNASIDAKEKAAEIIEQGKKKGSEDVDRGKQYMEQGKQKAAELVEDGKKQAAASMEKGREYYEKGRTQWAQY